MQFVRKILNKEKFLILVLFAGLLVAFWSMPLSVFAYSEGYYYGQGYYYAQGYYYGQGYYYAQSYYQGSYTLTFSKALTIGTDANILGTVTKQSGTFVIDHPTNPKNWLLYHSFVESPDVKNIYDGIATLDENGETTVELPNYFLALNKDFRYLATAIGQPMPNLHLSSEVKKRNFIFGSPVLKIAGGVPKGKISWQVTGIRHDLFIQKNPIIPEVEKRPKGLIDKGQYLCEECYGEK